MSYNITVAALAAALSVGAVSAHGGCVDPRQVRSSAVHMIPPAMLRGLNARHGPSTPHGGSTAAQNIVGTWVATYSDGAGGQAIIQWHDDGTEWENINFPVLGGNICLGSWKVVEARHAYRSHMGWLYKDGELAGYFTEIETDHLTSPDSYIGTNDTKIFDLSGNLQMEIPGTASAVRLVP